MACAFTERDLFKLLFCFQQLDKSMTLYLSVMNDNIFMYLYLYLGSQIVVCTANTDSRGMDWGEVLAGEMRTQSCEAGFTGNGCTKHIYFLSSSF